MKKLLLILALIAFNFGFSQNTVITTTSATSGTVSGNSTQQDEVMVHDGSTTISLTVAMPSNPTNGQKFTFVSSGGVTALTLSSVVGTISNAITTMAVGGNATYMYSSVNNKWYKIR